MLISYDLNPETFRIEKTVKCFDVDEEIRARKANINFPREVKILRM